VNVFHLLKSLQSSLFANGVQISYEFRSHSLLCAELLKSSLQFLFICYFLYRLAVGYSYSNNKTLSGLSVNVYFCKFITFKIGILHFFGSYIFSLLQFKDIFLAINNTDMLWFRIHGTYVTSTQPSIFRYSFFSLGFIMVITRKDSRTSSPNLSSRS